MAGVVASALYLVLEALDAFIATPLRETSSILVAAALTALGFPITRQGTILKTPNVHFDVVPACSGSTTLKVLLFVTVLWCGIHPRLTPGRRVVAGLLALPIALLANCLRVAALVVAGHLAGEEPAGFFHSATGVVAFVVALIGTFALTDVLASDQKERPSGGRGWIAAQAALLGFLAAPFVYWCARGWGGSPHDRFGYIFVGGAGLLGARAWRTCAPDRSREGMATLLFGGSLVLLVGATLAEVNLAKGIALLGTLLSLGLAAKGARFFRATIPLAGIAYLGFPTTSYQLQTVTLPLFGVGSVAASLLLKTFLGLGLGALGWTRWFRIPAPAGPPRPPGPPRSRFAPVRMALLAILAALQGTYFSIEARSLPRMQLEMSFLQGDWEGHNSEIAGTERSFFDGRIWSRRFVRGADRVDVLITSTGGDRHRAHPPAYCLTGDAWTIASESTDVASVAGRRVPLTRMTLRKEGREMAFAFWFTDGTEVHATYRDMLATDTFRRLTGRRTDWFLFRVMSEGGAAMLDTFLSTFSAAPVAAPGSP
jgi:EpsI family protein